ncbi:hypothetical protein TanjilG_13010 [Lupinus angustifolius]|uniref:HhH-GPD domain-containing protein n=1 Tax=Lupinus angustifolius TaxID=3871 RepID=A0A1J7GRQ5_LUPAN|nr:hypothetical protein TanjilG_13010 [Lupinus angustifolius]
MKGKEDENASKTIIIDSRKMRTPDVKYVSAHFNTVGENNVVVIPKRKSNVNSTENSNINAKKMRNNDVRYVSAYFNTVAEENVIIIPKRSRMKNENKVENDTNIIYVSAYFDFSKIRTKNVVVIPPRAKKNEIEMIDMHKDVKPLKSLPSELCSDAYRRKTHNNTWKPPKSLFRFEPLLQEYYVYDPWRVLVTSVLLNLTTGVRVRRVLSNLFNLCPNAKSCIEVEVQEIEQVIKTLGLQNKRAKALQRLSHEYLYGSWTHVTQLHGVGNNQEMFWFRHAHDLLLRSLSNMNHIFLVLEKRHHEDVKGYYMSQHSCHGRVCYLVGEACLPSTKRENTDLTTYVLATSAVELTCLPTSPPPVALTESSLVTTMDPYWSHHGAGSGNDGQALPGFVGQLRWYHYNHEQEVRGLEAQFCGVRSKYWKWMASWMSSSKFCHDAGNICLRASSRRELHVAEANIAHAKEEAGWLKDVLATLEARASKVEDKLNEIQTHASVLEGHLGKVRANKTVVEEFSGHVTYGVWENSQDQVQLAFPCTDLSWIVIDAYAENGALLRKDDDEVTIQLPFPGPWKYLVG